MRALIRFAVALLLPLFVGAQQPKPTGTPTSNVKMTALEQTLVAAIQEANDAWKKHDLTGVTAFWPDGVVLVEAEGPMTLHTADIAKLLQGCTMRSYSIEGLQARQITPDAALATFKFNVDQTCGGNEDPPSSYVTALFERRNGRWVTTFQQVTTAKR